MLARYPYTILYYIIIYIIIIVVFVIVVLWWKSIKTGRRKKIKQNPLVKMHATRSRVPRQQRRESTMSLTAVSVYNCTHIGVIVGARRVCRQTHADTHRTKHTAERPYIIFFFLIYCWVAYTISLYTEPNRSRVWVFLWHDWGECIFLYYYQFFVLSSSH